VGYTVVEAKGTAVGYVLTNIAKHEQPGTARTTISTD
jgi:hypothetical protein